MRKIYFFFICSLFLYSQTNFTLAVPPCDVQSETNNIISSDCQGIDWILGNLTIESGISISSGSGANAVTVNGSLVGILDNNGGTISSEAAGISASFGSSISGIINRGQINMIEPLPGAGMLAGGDT